MIKLNKSKENRRNILVGCQEQDFLKHVVNTDHRAEED